MRNRKSKVLYARKRLEIEIIIVVQNRVIFLELVLKLSSQGFSYMMDENGRTTE